MENKTTNEDLHSLMSVISRGLGVTDSDDTQKFLEAIAMQLGMGPYGHVSTLKEEMQQINENLSDIAGKLGKLADIFSKSDGNACQHEAAAPEPDVLNSMQVATMLGRTPANVHNYWKSGALKRKDGTRAYRREDVQDFIEKHRVTTDKGYYYSMGNPRG